MGLKRNLSCVAKGKKLAAPFDYSQSNQVCSDKRRRTFSSITEESSMCYETATSLTSGESDHSYLTNRRLFRSVSEESSTWNQTALQLIYPGLCNTDKESSDGEDVVEDLPGAARTGFGQAMYQRTRKGVTVEYFDCGDDSHMYSLQCLLLVG